MPECSECAGELKLKPDTEEAEIIVCPDCGVELEVRGLHPMTFALAPQLKEDWGE